MKEGITGAQALALGALQAGVSVVTSYPGSPATGVVDHILEQSPAQMVQVHWASNEKAAVEIAFGGSLAGVRTLLAVKSVGFNIALDPLMTINLSGSYAGFVILLGDDPGSWGSQNEQDSRALAKAAGLPVMEPTGVQEGYQAMRHAFDLSQSVGLPVVVRVTRAMAAAQATVEIKFEEPVEKPSPLPFLREFNRWVVLPYNVVSNHLRLEDRLLDIQARFEISPFNEILGSGSKGIVAAGFAYQKLMDVLQGQIPPELRILRLGTFYPLPVKTVRSFLQQVDSVLVLEETDPLVEHELSAVACRGGRKLPSEKPQEILDVPVYGRGSGHIPRAGELFAPHIAAALNRYLPDLNLPETGEDSRPMPSLKPFSESCFYTTTFAALNRALEKVGGREMSIVVGDPGCMVRAQNDPVPLMDVKHSLGSSIGIAAGISLGQRFAREKVEHVVAIIGDSSFLHTGLNGLMDAVQVEANILVLILDNDSVALTGGQPTPASGRGARGESQRALSLVDWVRAAGVNAVESVDVDGGGDILAAFERSLGVEGVAVVIARGRCDCD